LLLKKKYDVVISISPPFHLGFYAWAYAKLRGAKLVTHIQDLQVDAAKELGMINNRRLLNGMIRAERFLLRHSDAVSSISLGMKRKILEKGIPDSKYVMFPNWVDVYAIRPLPKSRSLRREWNIPDTDTVVLYSGNLGEKQGLEIILEAAEHFRSQKQIHFIICGTGGAGDRLKELAAQAGLLQVRFYPLQPYDKLSALLATADIHLVLQKKSASDLVMPSKLTGILASGGFPIVSTVPDSALYEVVAGHRLGLVIEPESTDALVKGLQQALTTDLTVFRENGRRYAEQFLTKEGILPEFEQNLRKLVGYENT